MRMCVFVTPEYNFGPPPPLVNALNYVYKEWNYKPAGIVSYGGVSGGVRSALVEKITLTTLKMMPMGVRQRAEYCHPYRCQQQIPTG